MAEVMFDQDGTRIVLLNRSFGDAGRDMKELRVRFTKNGAMFFHLAQDAEPKNYGISAAEADAFCAAWTKFKADQEANKKTEEERKHALIREAHAIAARHPEISIMESANYWTVSIPSQRYEFRHAAQYPETLLEQVKTCRAVLVGREDVQATV